MADDNVINFPRIGFDLGTPRPAGDAGDPPPAGFAWAPAPGSRRSPLDSLAALPAPGLARPVISMPEPGFVPDTFRSEPVGEASASRLGALSLAAVLAVSVAALRGIHSAVTAWKASREQRDAAQALADKSKAVAGVGGGGAKKQIPPGHEYGRKSLGRTSSASGSGGGSKKSSGGSGGSGGSKGSGSSGRKSSSASPSKTGGSGKSSKTGGSGKSSRSSGTSSAAGKGGSGKPSKRSGPVHRTSQGGTGSVKKKGSGAGTPGSSRKSGKAPSGAAGPKGILRSKKDASGRTALPGAVKKDVQKAAARRWKRRQKLKGQPPVWAAPKKGGSSTGPAGKTKGRGKPAKAGKTPPKPKGAGSGRTTLTGAVKKDLQKAAVRRWKRREKRMAKPPVWTCPRKVSLKKKAKGKPGATKGGSSTGPGATTTPKPSTPKPPKAPKTPKVKAKKGKKAGPGRAGGGRWSKVRSRARERWNKRRASTARDAAGQSSTAAGGDDFWFEFVDGQYTGDPRGNARTRRSPWESAGMAGGMDGSTITVERADRPNSHTGPAVGIGVPALPAAATPHTERPRTTKPIPMPAAPPRTPRTPTMTTPAHLRTPAMDPQHATEITLDDALDVLEQLTRESFTTHDECVDLAQRARGIRNRLADLAIDLQATHNVIGHLTAAAMVRLAESMDVLARKADEMQTSSLQAAELSEAADNSLNDAYRPITQATADAGLAVPSARIHNEG
ncbi:MAG: putative glycine-rich protein [Frankiales bacterium]|nr:putative glycine-rich protein [Frankiales bacterium]